MKITADIEEGILRGYVAGEGSTTLAKRYSLCKKSVSTVLRGHGVIIRPLGVRGRKYPINHDAFSTDSTEARYWAGAMMTDGCVYRGKPGSGSPKIILQVAGQDYQWVEDFRSFIGYGGPITKGWRTDYEGVKSGPYPRLSAASSKIAEDLARFGVVPRKTKTARVPTHLIDDASFWRGCLDGDGHIRIDGNGSIVVGFTGWEGLVNDFAAFAERLVRYRIRVYPSVSKKGRWWSSYLNARNAYTLLQYLYGGSGPRLQRKGDAATGILTKYARHHWRESTLARV